MSKVDELQKELDEAREVYFRQDARVRRAANLNDLEKLPGLIAERDAQHKRCERLFFEWENAKEEADERREQPEVIKTEDAEARTAGARLGKSVDKLQASIAQVQADYVAVMKDHEAVR